MTEQGSKRVDGGQMKGYVKSVDMVNRGKVGYESVWVQVEIEGGGSFNVPVEGPSAFMVGDAVDVAISRASSPETQPTEQIANRY